MTIDTSLREHLGRLLAWEDAHAGFDSAIKDLSAAHRGTVPRGLPYSAWQLIEHLRITQHDILDFCVNADYKEKEWPRDYWPASAEPPSAKAWDESVRQYRGDRQKLQELAADPAIDLAATIPHGTGQTYLRELLLVADHTSYHVGQLVLLRRLLGDWS
jgi:uncharacterized damage-inducible protein DinB